MGIMRSTRGYMVYRVSKYSHGQYYCCCGIKSGVFLVFESINEQGDS